MKTQSLLPWYGTDAAIAKDLSQLLDGCDHVTIPFCGGLGILPHLSARAVLANDLHLHAIEFYRALQHDDLRAALIKRCKTTLCHPEELRIANARLQVDDKDSHNQARIDRAWAYWARCWLGRKGQGGTPQAGQSASIRRNAGGGTNATRIVSAASDLEEWAALFHRVEFLCEDFRAVIGKLKDLPDCGCYCDPPWLKEGGLYEHTFSERDHEDLARDLNRFANCKIVVRYGDHPLLRELYPLDRWTWIEEASRTQSNSVRGEVWITKNLGMFTKQLGAKPC